MSPVRSLVRVSAELLITVVVHDVGLNLLNGWTIVLGFLAAGFLVARPSPPRMCDDESGSLRCMGTGRDAVGRCGKASSMAGFSLVASVDGRVTIGAD